MSKEPAIVKVEDSKKHICCDGECNHDDCCGKIEANCPLNQAPESKEELEDTIKGIIFADDVDYRISMQKESVGHITYPKPYQLRIKREEALSKARSEGYMQGTQDREDDWLDKLPSIRSEAQRDFVEQIKGMFADNKLAVDDSQARK